MAAVRPGRVYTARFDRSSRSARAYRPSRTLMSSSPRMRRSPTVMVVVAALVLIALAVLVVVSGAGQAFVTGLYPPVAVTEQGARIRDLYTVVFILAVVIFLVVEGLIIWTVIRYRR